MLDSFTVDWEDYYPYPVKNFEEFYNSEFKSILEPMTMNLLEIFASYDIKTTFFCIGHLAKLQPNTIKKIIQCGHELGSHTYSHRFLNEVSFQKAKQDIIKSINILEDISGKKIECFRAPSFSISSDDKAILELLISNGIKYDSSFSSAHHEYGTKENNNIVPHIIRYENMDLIELPISIYKKGILKVCYSGGGYFRIIPTKFILSEINKLKIKDTPFIGYIHPRDLFSSQQIIINYKDLRRTILSYIGLKKTKSKFLTVLNMLNVRKLSEVAEHIRCSLPVHNI